MCVSMCPCGPTHRRCDYTNGTLPHVLYDATYQGECLPMAVRPRRPRVYFAAAQSPVVGVNHDLFPSPTADTWGTSISGRYNHNLASDPHTSVWQRLGNSKARTPRSRPAVPHIPPPNRCGRTAGPKCWIDPPHVAGQKEPFSWMQI